LTPPLDFYQSLFNMIIVTSEPESRVPRLLFAPTDHGATKIGELAVCCASMLLLLSSPITSLLTGFWRGLSSSIQFVRGLGALSMQRLFSTTNPKLDVASTSLY
jgi:hypothetical protein